ncbi:MAG: hypothetical protein IPM56_13375 [Ignavibacteriales bacterium]|nr:MAG: hypothetical protein IPM56_13375 [Ignavibacteriales bacterium]
MLKIDQENAPESVMFVTATLTRENFDTLTSTMNILSDTSADLTFNEVAAGNWLLKVDAKDSIEQILYTGSAEVTVLAGILTQVNLVLNPTGVGTGGVYIYVTWGTPTSYSWIDYPQNPVLAKSNVSWESLGIQQSKVLYIDGQYKMWYLGLSGGPYVTICYATSTDGINWVKSNMNPVIVPTIGSWDEEAVGPGAVYFDDGIYTIYYVGWANQNGQWNIGRATSTDGINWTKDPHPILYASGGWEYQIAPASVVKLDGTYYLYYYGISSGTAKIGLATSTDGITWNRYSNNPILEKTQNWEGTGIYYPAVIHDNGMFKMVYMNRYGNLTAFGTATSSDGKNWTKSADNPFFTEENTANNWALYDIAYPNYIKLENEYRIYYSGIGQNSSWYKIGFMRKQIN